MGDIARLDELDRQIVAALQVDGRASWSAVAHALGTSETTVARRGQYLLDSRTVTVTGLLDDLRCGLGIGIIVRMRCRPGRANAVADALAELPTVRFVTVVSGSADVAAELVVPRHEDVASVLVEDLPRPDDIVDTESMVVVRKFRAFEEWDTGLLGPAATAALRPRRAVGEHTDWSRIERLSESELVIARLLARQGRATYTRIAAASGASESTVARRVESLVTRGCLRFRAMFEPQVVGFDVNFMQWLAVEPSRLEEAGRLLAKEPSSRYVGATTGRFNLVLHGSLPGYGDLYDYLTRVVGSLPGVQAADMTLQARTLKRAWLRLGDDERVVA
ncbi:Lrp/AsnC family transcriptional regulator [Pseudonocardia sp. HH130630-07]|uniref:Lrp/AsnC family transcriptional regulator n=1 Tax=Pseudonocardia sp. HH130630-07 TaxID=1690815 RepID=UPI000814DC63|nr:Lrp/AsnC family transcriptional regulator [Pseudonocardia sp. HH130630-07]ANY09407.1 hypothetical protein AFB00_27765 [Pseudonocardia sp. HH130630-07]